MRKFNKKIIIVVMIMAAILPLFFLFGCGDRGNQTLIITVWIMDKWQSRIIWNWQKPNNSVIAKSSRKKIHLAYRVIRYPLNQI